MHATPDFDPNQLPQWASAVLMWLAFGAVVASRVAAVVKRLSTFPLRKGALQFVGWFAVGLRYVRDELIEKDATDRIERQRLHATKRLLLRGLILALFSGYFMQLEFMVLDHWKIFQWQGIEDIAGAIGFALAVSIVRRRQQNLEILAAQG